jgi:hypothetical protein
VNFPFISTILVTFGLIASNAASAAEPAPLSARTLANKLAFVTVGHPASPAEITRFEREIAENSGGFTGAYNDLISRYLADSDYAHAVERSHTVWWRLSTGSAAQHAAYVVTHNLPYSEVYSRNYLYTDGSMTTIYDQMGAKVLGDLPDQPGDFRKLPLMSDEPRFRGFFGSPEFLRIYPDTESNVNRKRANQVFRIAFCETVSNASAVAPPVETFADEHGQNPDCMGCHRRLDPVARFFDRWRPPTLDGFYAEYDPTRADAGKVFLGGPIGMERSIDGIGDGGLGAIIVRQPEFGQCVANLAWNFVFGKEVVLDAATKAKLVAEYDRSKQFNPMVIAALKHQYFWSDAEIPSVKFDSVSPLLTTCAQCHVNSSMTRFDPANYPFRTDPTENFAFLRRFWGAVNRYSGYRPMPDLPRPKLDQDALDLMRSWILAGARDIRDNVTLTEVQIEELLQ